MMSVESRQAPTLVAVGGGKGGIGKSVVSLLVGQWLARMGHRTTVVDLDFSGANLHTLLGIREAPVSLHDVLEKRADSLEQIALDTDLPGFRVICGASEVLSAANPVFARKLKLMRGLFTLDSDFVMLDLGAGTSFNVLDFFLLADLQVVVTTAEPTSIYNAYAFIRNAAFRRLAQLTRQYPVLQELVNLAMDPKAEGCLRTLADVYHAVEECGGKELLTPLQAEMGLIHPLLLVNRVQNPRERNSGRILQQVAAKYLDLKLEDLGGIPEDPEIRSLISRMVSITRGSGYRGAWEEAREVAQRLIVMARRARRHQPADRDVETAAVPGPVADQSIPAEGGPAS